MTRAAGKLFFILLPKLNIAFSLSAAILAVYLVVILVRPYNPDPLAGKDLKLKLHELSGKANTPEIKGIDFEEDSFRKRELFSQSGLWKEPDQEKTFVLMGVSVGNKKLAMIRSSFDGKDYYCGEGDKIGDFTVKQILKDKVILESDKGETLEIHQ